MSTPGQDHIIASSSDYAVEAQDTHLPLLNDSSHIEISDSLSSQDFAPSDPNLCNVCNFILQNRVELGSDYKHPQQPNLFELERAAQNGCHLCRLILSSIKPDKFQKIRIHHDRVQRVKRWERPEFKVREILIWYRIEQQPPGFTINFRGRISENAPWDTSNPFSFYEIGYFLCDLIAVEDSYEIVDDLSPTVNDQTWALVVNWLQTCLTSHVKCDRGRNLEAWLPSRLLDIGEVDSTIEPRLCPSVEVPQDSKYIALSHCWGQLKILRLLERNLESFKLSIPWHKLSSTFQDAILITKHFRVRYLWIDSLFIIQDSTTDWEQEAAMMGRVYERCWLNIAASAASDGSRGFLPKTHRTVPLLKAIKAQTSWLSQTQGAYPFHPRDLKMRILRDEPLGRRA